MEQEKYQLQESIKYSIDSGSIYSSQRPIYSPSMMYIPIQQRYRMNY